MSNWSCPKRWGQKTRLIFHLSHPRKGGSVNAGIPPEKCKVVYPDFDQAVQMCLDAGIGCKIGKSDMASAFRHVPLRVCDFKYMILKADHPISGKTYYFVNKCLPFGSSISCSRFQAVSDVIAFIVTHCNRGNRTLNYLDDFFFTALCKIWCDQQIGNFIQVCKEIKFPVALEKTFQGTTVLVFLGLLLDTELQLVCIPKEKIAKAQEVINFFLERGNKKVTVLQLQQLCGYLNFLCKCIFLGRAFMMCLYAPLTGSNKKLKPYHHIKFKEENRLDLIV